MVAFYEGSKPCASENPHMRTLQPSQGHLQFRYYCNYKTIMNTIILVVLILLLVGAFPAWPHSSKWGYYPSGGIGLVVLILIILLLTGRL